MFNNFVKPGNPGIKLKPEYDRLLKAVSLPKLVDLECKDLNVFILFINFHNYLYLLKKPLLIEKIQRRCR